MSMDFIKKGNKEERKVSLDEDLIAARQEAYQIIKELSDDELAQVAAGAGDIRSDVFETAANMAALIKFSGDGFAE